MYACSRALGPIRDNYVYWLYHKYFRIAQAHRRSSGITICLVSARYSLFVGMSISKFVVRCYGNQVEISGSYDISPPYAATNGTCKHLTQFLDPATRRGERSASHPGRFQPSGKTRYPLYRRLGGPQGWSGQVRKISPPTGFDPRTVQHVASRDTDWTTRPTFPCISWNINKIKLISHIKFNLTYSISRWDYCACRHSSTIR
jgi:hypothetical protein